jgi:hypothetical protein
VVQGRGSQDTATAVRRPNRNNKEVDYGLSMEMIEESDEDEDLGGYSSGSEDLDGPSLESANEGGDVDENTESSAPSTRNVDRTLV